MRHLLAFLMWLCLAVPASAQPGTAERLAVEQASARGRLIYAYDQAAWHGTDDLVANAPQLRERIGGWIVDGPADRPTLVFFDRDTANPHALYTVTFAGAKIATRHVVATGENGMISAAQRGLIDARRRALEVVQRAKLPGCSDQPPNTVVLPPEREGGPTRVYVLTPQPDLRTFPIGGNYLVEVAADGQASAPQAFAKTCIAMTVPADRKPEMFVLTHLLGRTPTEIHVFASLAAHLPIAVATPNRSVWSVAGDRITILSKRDR